MCGLGNSISETYCGNTIILVEYLHVDPPVVVPEPPPPPPPTVPPPAPVAVPVAVPMAGGEGE